MAVMNRTPYVDLSDIVQSLFDVTSTHKPATTFPPYNLISNKDNTQLVIEIAVAGFRQEDLAISAESERLVVRGKRPADMDGNVVFHHQGIAKRSFELKWHKSADFEVTDASLEDGLLVITLQKTRGLPTEIPIQKKLAAPKDPQLLTE